MRASHNGAGSRRVEVAVVLTGIAALVALAFLVWPRVRAEPAAATPIARTAPAKPAWTQQRPLPQHPPSLANDEKTPGEIPLADGEVRIDDVRVDKSEICRGEEVILSIFARTSDGGAPFLNFGVVGQAELTGPRIAMHPEGTIAAGESRVFVRGKNGKATMAFVPPVVVKDCDAPLSLQIGYGRKARIPDRAWFSADPVTSPRSTEPQFQPVSYTWDFGDGTTEETSSAHVEHSYEGRLQDAAYSYFLVTVKARDAAGREVRGSRSVRFVNLGFDPNQSAVTVFSGVDERAQGGEAIWLYHGASEAVHIQRVTVTDEALDARSGPAEDLPAEGADAQEHDPAALLGFTELPSGTSRTVRSLAHLRPKHAGVVRVVRIVGESADGIPASGEFDLVAESQPIAGATPR